MSDQAMQQQVSDLRRKLVEQLNQINQLLKPILQIDADYFGGHFLGTSGSADAAATPEKIAIAVKVMRAVNEEINGAGAFVDSPLLRDRLKRTVSACVTLQGVTESMAKHSLVRNSNAEIAKRSFSDENPLACLTDCTAFLTDIYSALKPVNETLERLEGSMGSENSGNSSEALQQAKAIADLAREEASALQEELNLMRGELARLQEGSGQSALTKNTATSASGGTAQFRDICKQQLADLRSLLAELLDQCEEFSSNAFVDVKKRLSDILQQKVDDVNEVFADALAVAEDAVRLLGEEAQVTAQKQEGFKADKIPAEDDEKEHIHNLERQLEDVQKQLKLAQEKISAAANAEEVSGEKITRMTQEQREEVDELRTRLGAAEAQVASIEGERDRLTTVRADLEHQIELLEQRIQAQRKESGAHDQEAQSKINDILQDLEDQRQRYEKRLEEAENQFREERQRLHTQRTDLEQKLEQSQGETRVAETDKDVLHEQLAKLEKKLAADIEKERQHQAQIESEKQELEQQIHTQLQKQEERAATHAQEASEQSDAMSSLQDQVNDLRTKLNRSTSRADELERDLEIARDELDKAQHAVEEAKRESVKAEQERSKLRGQIEERDREIVALSKERGVLRQDLDRAKDSEKRAKELERKLQDEDEKQEAARDNWREDEVELQERIKTLEADAQQAQDNIAERESEIRSLQRSLDETSSLHHDIERLESELRQQKRLLEERTKELSEYKVRSDEVRKRATEAESQSAALAELEKEVAEYHSKVHVLQEKDVKQSAELKKYKDELDQYRRRSEENSAYAESLKDEVESERKARAELLQRSKTAESDRDELKAHMEDRLRQAEDLGRMESKEEIRQMKRLLVEARNAVQKTLKDVEVKEESDKKIIGELMQKLAAAEAERDALQAAAPRGRETQKE